LTPSSSPFEFARRTGRTTLFVQLLSLKKSSRVHFTVLDFSAFFFITEV
jgi:hypothetical protein